MTLEKHIGLPSAVVGYARTSTADQRAGLQAQIDELEAAGCHRVFHEHASAFGRRPQLDGALDWVRAGDVLVVTKPDRLARNVTDLLSLVELLRRRDVTLRILSMNLDTSNPTSMLALSLLSAVGLWEREAMLERQRAGIAKAKAEGKYKGRAPTARQKSAEILAMLGQGARVVDVVREVGVSRASIYRIAASGALAAGPPVIGGNPTAALPVLANSNSR